MSELNPEAWKMSLHMGIGYEQAVALMYGLPHVVVDQMRPIDAPNYGNYWAHNSTSSRGSLFVDEAPRERVKYTPRSTNAKQDHMEKALARKKEREKVAKIASLEERNNKESGLRYGVYRCVRARRI